MKYKKILQLLINVVLLFNTMWCLAFSLNKTTAEQSLSKCAKTHEVISAETIIQNSLLIGNPISIPTPTLTILSGGVNGNSCSNKTFQSAFLGIAFADILFLNYYNNKTTTCRLQPVPLHLAFCVFRI